MIKMKLNHRFSRKMHFSWGSPILSKTRPVPARLGQAQPGQLGPTKPALGQLNRAKTDLVCTLTRLFEIESIKMFIFCWTFQGLAIGYFSFKPLEGFFGTIFGLGVMENDGFYCTFGYWQALLQSGYFLAKTHVFLLICNTSLNYCYMLSYGSLVVLQLVDLVSI